MPPDADLALNGGGTSEQDFSGSLMVDTNVRLNGHFKFHWDEALGRMASDNDARYLVKSWNEIRSLGASLQTGSKLKDRLSSRGNTVAAP